MGLPPLILPNIPSVLGGVMPAWVQPGAIFDDDFFNARAWPRPFASEMVDARASDQYVPNAAGVWTKVSPGVLPISSSYLEVEPTAVNLVPDSAMQGVVTGTPGTPPNSWSTFGTAFTSCGITASIQSAFVESGIDFLRLNLTTGGSNTSSAGAFTWTTGAFTVASGDTISGEWFFRTVSGNWTGFNSFSNGARLQLPTSVSQFNNISPTLYPSITRLSVSAVATAAGSGQAAWSFNWKIGFPIDITIDLGWPQAKSSGISSPIRTTSAAATRAANAITLQRTGIGRIVFTFDNDSQQTVSGIDTATQYTLPTNLNRSLIKRMTGYAS